MTMYFPRKFIQKLYFMLASFTKWLWILKLILQSIHSPNFFETLFDFILLGFNRSLASSNFFFAKKNKNEKKKTKNERKKHICSIETFNDLCERMEKKFKTQVQFCMQKNAQCTQHNHCNETLLWSTSRFHHLSKCLFFIFYSFSHQLFHFPCLLLCDIAQFKTSAKSRPHQFAYYFSFVFVCVGVRLLFRMFSIRVANDKFFFSLFFSFVVPFPSFFSVWLNECFLSLQFSADIVHLLRYVVIEMIMSEFHSNSTRALLSQSSI